jgi:hypothetical protein
MVREGASSTSLQRLSRKAVDGRPAPAMTRRALPPRE